MYLEGSLNVMNPGHTFHTASLPRSLGHWIGSSSTFTSETLGRRRSSSVKYDSPLTFNAIEVEFMLHDKGSPLLPGSSVYCSEFRNADIFQGVREKPILIISLLTDG